MEQEKEYLEQLQNIYQYYKDKEAETSLSVVLYKCIRLLDFRISEYEFQNKPKEEDNEVKE